jgi:iron complex outermembrane receptor protein
MNKFIILFVVYLFFLNVSAQEDIKVQDSTKTENLEEVFLKAVRVNADSPFTHSNIDKKELAKRNLGQDLPILLNYLPGVVTTSDAGAGVGYTGIRVRGSDATRVNVTINGIPFNDSESQGTFWVDLPDFASSVQSLQLQRGVGTSTNGSGAFGASLNLLTDAVSQNAYGEIATSYGSFETWKHTLKFSTGLLQDHFELSGRLSKIVSEGYIDRASSDLKSYFVQATYTADNTLIKTLAFGGKERTYQSWFGIDAETLKNDRTFNPAGIYTDANGTIRFYENEVDDYTQDHYQVFWNQRYDTNWSSNVSLNYTYGRGFFEQFKEDADLAFHNIEPIIIGGEVIETSDLIRRRWLNNNFYAVNANVNYLNDRWDVSSGVFYSYYGGDHFGEVIWARFAGNSQIRDRYYSGNGDKNEFTVFSKTTFRINDQWSVYGDLQGRFVSYRTSGLTSDKIPLVENEKYQYFNPKTGVTYKFSIKSQLYFSYGRASREPGRSDFEQGIFTSEKLDDFELGWRYNSEKLKVNSNLYFMDYKDQLVLTGALDDVGAPIRATSGNSYRLGLEVDAKITVADKLFIIPNIALSENKNKDFVTSLDGSLVNLGDTHISFSPSVIAANIIEYNPVESLQFAFLSKYVGMQYMGNIDSEVSKLSDYFINDLSINYTLENVLFINKIVVSGLVNNLFNVEYVSNGYFFTFDDDFSDPPLITTIEGAGFYPQARINFLLGVILYF